MDYGAELHLRQTQSHHSILPHLDIFFNHAPFRGNCRFSGNKSARQIYGLLRDSPGYAGVTGLAGKATRSESAKRIYFGLRVAAYRFTCF
jgi:hypothetical protein